MLTSQPLEILQLGDSSDTAPSPLQLPSLLLKLWKNINSMIFVLRLYCTYKTTTKPFHSTASICVRQLLFTLAPKISKGVHKSWDSLEFRTIQICGLEVFHHKTHLVHSVTHLNPPINSSRSHYTDLKRLFLCIGVIFNVSQRFLWLKKNKYKEYL